MEHKSKGINAKKYFIYPDDTFKAVWDVIIAMYFPILTIYYRLVVLTCATTPFYLAFPDSYEEGNLALDTTISLLFFADVVINFITAYYDEDYTIIDDPKVRSTF